MELNDEINDLIKIASNLCVDYNSPKIKVEHFVLSVLSSEDEITKNYITECDVIVNDLYTHIDYLLLSEAHPKIRHFKNKPIDDELNKLFELSLVQQEKLKEGVLKPYHVMLAILSTSYSDENMLKKILNKNGLYYNNMFEKIIDKKFYPETSIINQLDESIEPEDNKILNKKDKPLKKQNISKKFDLDTPTINSYCKNYNKISEEGKIEPVIGRDNEIKRLSQILTRKKKNNAIIVGEGGVGKTAIVEGLAYAIVNKTSPNTLFNKTILSLDITSLTSGTKYRGQLEERVKSLMNDLSKTKDVILFIDEIHMITGGNNGLDIANMIKPSLSNGELQVIGATTINEYRESIEKDSALNRRFQKIQVEEPTIDETIIILNKIKKYYEEYHNVTYSNEVIEDCVKLTKRYVTDRYLPDSAIDVMDETAAKFRINSNINNSNKTNKLEAELDELIKEKAKYIEEQEFDKVENELIPKIESLLLVIEKENKKNSSKKNVKIKQITSEEIKNVISEMTKIPVSKIGENENKKLLDLENVLNNKIIGQEEAIKKICQAIKRSRVGIKDPNKPFYSAIFLGSSGVGKTMLVKEISEEIFGSKDSMIRIDMSEYMEKYSISKLIGSPPGYVGYGEGGLLTEAVRKKPFSVILLDEIEKAHPDVFNVFLQILDDGQATDSNGRKINFKNTIIIMTSNVGAVEANTGSKSLGFSVSNTNPQEVANKRKNEIITKELKKKFKPEFLNRIDDIICFNSLNEENLSKIIKLEINKLIQRLEDNNYFVKKYDEKIISYLLKKGTNLEYGARPLARAIQEEIENKIADFILSNDNVKNIEILLNDDNNEILIK